MSRSKISTTLIILSLVFSAVVAINDVQKDFVVTLETGNKESLFNLTEFAVGEDRVVGGVEAIRNEFPSVAHILVSMPNGYAVFCGAIIIQEYWVMTSAHCIWPLDSRNVIKVTAGDHYRNGNEGTEQIRYAKRMITRAGYNSVTSVNDIALLELSERFNINQYVAVATLANPTYIAEGNPITTGWGTISAAGGATTNELRKATLNFVSNTECIRAYQDVSNADIRASTICASGTGKGPCSGDSGGPLMCSSSVDGLFVCGINSFMVECGNPRWPSGFERVSSHIEWIKTYVSVLHTSTPQPTTTTTTQATNKPGSGVKNTPSIFIFVIALLYTIIMN